MPRNAGRGTVIKRSPGSFTISAGNGTDPVTGKRRRIWRTIKTTSKRVARKELTKLLAEIDNGTVATSGHMTAGEWHDKWLHENVRLRNSPRTAQGYKSHVDIWIKPQFGHVRLDALSPSHVQQLMARIFDKGRSANTANHVFTTLRLSLKDAVRQGMITRNVCDAVDRPKVQQFAPNPPDLRGIKSILNEAKGTEYEAILDFMVATGCRRGEAVALKWEHVDLDKGVVSIVSSAVRVKGQGQILNPTKTTSSKRGISLDDSITANLRRHRSNQTEYIMSVADIYAHNDFVFANASGNMIDLDHLSQAFKRIARRAGCPHSCLHDLRHFHATALIASGAHVCVVQDRLGHSSAAFTLNRYGHVAAGLQEQAAARFELLMNSD